MTEHYGENLILEKGATTVVREIFEGYSKSMVRYGLEAQLGFLTLDATEQTGCYQIGNFLYIDGVVNPVFWQDYQVKQEISEKIIISENVAWQKYLENCSDLVTFTRYAFLDRADFDLDSLNQIIENLDTGYDLLPFSEKIYETLGQKEWSKDLQGFTSSYNEFSRSGGFGYVICREDEIVAGVSTGLVYKEAIEIEIATVPRFQRRGLAKILAAKMILTSKKRGVFPLWDAHNLASKAIAASVGYISLGAYLAYESKESYD